MDIIVSEKEFSLIIQTFHENKNKNGPDQIILLKKLENLLKEDS